MILHRLCFHWRTVQGDSGGTIAGGPFRITLTVFGANLIYREGEYTLTLPVEYGLRGSRTIGTALIRNWDGSSEQFNKDEMFTIKKNIFAALDHMGVRYTNIP